MDADFLARGRAGAESLMTDTCRITRQADDRGELNPATGKYDDPDPIVVYEGVGRIPGRGSPSPTGSTRPDNAGEADWGISDDPLTLPLTGPGYVSGEIVGPGQTVLWLTAADDTLVGREFQIIAPARKTTAVARRFLMREVVSS